MPRVITPAKTVSEIRNQKFDFTGLFASTTDTIAGQTVTATVYSGVDAAPSMLISGAPTHSGLVVSQKITGGVLGVIYYLTCLATSAAGEVIEISTFLAIVPDVV